MSIDGEPPSLADQRLLWMDMARGLAVTFVIILHCGSYLHETGHEIPTWLQSVNNMLAPSRIPMLMFLSGILLPRSVDKGIVKFTYGKFRNLFWPYAVWLTIFCIVTGKPAYLLYIGSWAGGTYLWYMAFLMAYFALAIPLARAPHWIVAIYALALAFLMPDGTKYGERFFLLMAFFFLGAFVGQRLPQFVRLLNSPSALALSAIVAGLAIASSATGALRYSPAHAAIVGAGIVGLCALLFRVSASKFAYPMVFVGKRSLIFYAIHFPVIVMTSLLMLRLDVPASSIVVVNMLMAFLIATICVKLADANRYFNMLFSAPDFLSFRPGTRAGKLSEDIDRLKIIPKM